ncbi:MAG: hypothetical protein QOF62_2905 [Pyrinomonadaceae bacterium]|jgi:tetratricopeptide (TPR) repeat protein|nr:hypothetical protein [Pyrinomonadaceae bacterium]
MSEVTNDKNFFGFTKTAFGWITAVGGFITALVSFIKLLSGDARLVIYILLAIAGLVLWGSCFYMYFLKKKDRMKPGVTSRVPAKVNAFPPRVRRIAWWGMLVVPGLALLGGLIQLYYAYKPSDKIVVTVANFQSLDSSISATTERLLAQLREATKHYESDIKIDPLQKAITEQEGGSDAAQSIGRDRKATIVIWGWTNKDVIRAYFEVLMSRGNYLSDLGTNQPMDLIVAGHETFQLQMNLSEDMTYLTLLVVGLARYESQDYDGATRSLRDALSHVTQSPEAGNDRQDKIAIGYFYLARAFADQGNYDQAKANFIEALKHNPNHGAAHLHLGYIYHFFGDDDSANKEFDRAIELYGALIASNPKNTDAYNDRGSAYSNRGNLEKALEDYNQVIQSQPSDARAYARAFNNRGFVFYKQGNTNRALEDFNRAINLSPHDASPFNNRGAAYSDLGKFKEALNDYGKVIEYRPKSSLSYLSRAFVYFDKHDYNAAISDYDRAIQLGPNNFRAYRNRAWSHLFLGHYNEAAADAQKFLDLQQPCKNNKDFMYVAILGYISLRKASQPGPAGTLLDKAISECGPSKWQYSLLRFLHHDISAQQLQAEAGADKDKSTEAFTYIGLDLLFLGQRKQALEDFQWVRDHGTSDFDEYHLALAEIERLKANPGT